MTYIDVSEHQGVIDWEKVKNNVDGVIIRVGYGQNGVDKHFERNISECNRLGIQCGVYFFSYAYTADMAKKEAERCIEMIAPYKVELPVAFDYEYDSFTYGTKNGVKVNAALVNSIVKAFCSTVEKAGYYCMNYANPDFLNKYMTDVAAYDLWLAHWGVKKPSSTCGIWQWGGSAVPGITGNVDTNEVYKDYKTIIKNANLNHLADKWYTAPMAWAKENGIIKDDRAEDFATRAEVAQMFYNFDKRYSGLLTDD